MGKIFITGATGLVGTTLTEYLVSSKPLGIMKPTDIICYVRTPEKATFLQSLGVQIIQGCLEEKEKLYKIFQEHPIETVFHLAANVFVYSTYVDMYKTNVEGVHNMLDAFTASNATTFIHTSSIIVYDHHLGQYPEHSYKEEDAFGPIDPKKDVPYAITKRKGELLVHNYIKRFPEKKFIITRLGPVIGPRDRQMIPALKKATLMKIPKLINHGKGILCLVSPLDIAHAQIFLAENAKKFNGEVFNVANGMKSYLELFTLVSQYYNKKPPKISIPLWLFHMVKPFLVLVRLIFPHNKFFRTFFSPTALIYFDHSYFYSSEKLKQSGFHFHEEIDSVIIRACNCQIKKS